jgi:hypothetical protein
MTMTEANENQAIDHNDLDANAAAVAQLAAQTVNKPVIDHLPDAVVTDDRGTHVFLAKPGEKVVIERYATVLSHRPWLDTKTYTVMSVETVTGVVNLFDEDLHRHSSTNYVSAIKGGYRIKLATKSTDIGKKKRGRPRKNPPVEVKPVELGTDGKPVAKKRGRPAGSKNRAKDVIQAEKAAKAKLRAAKRAKAPTANKRVAAVLAAPVVEAPKPKKTVRKPKAKKPAAKKAAKKVVAKKPAKKTTAKKSTGKAKR